jgi:ferredoxin like protein
MKLPALTQRLAQNRFVTDDSASHIQIDQALMAASGSADRLIAACPAGVYSRAGDGSLTAEAAACLECGTCLAIAAPGSIRWHYPKGGFGVQYREG